MQQSDRCTFQGMRCHQSKRASKQPQLVGKCRWELRSTDHRLVVERQTQLMSCTPQIAAQSLLVCATGLWQRATRDISVEHYVARLDYVPMIVRRLTLATSAGLHLLNPGKKSRICRTCRTGSGPQVHLLRSTLARRAQLRFRQPILNQGK